MPNKITVIELMELERIAAKNRLEGMQGRKTKKKHSLEAIQRDRTHKILAGDPNWTPLGEAALKAHSKWKVKPHYPSVALIVSILVGIAAGVIGIAF